MLEFFFMEKHLIFFLLFFYSSMNFAQNQLDSVELSYRSGFEETRIKLSNSGTYQLENGVKIPLKIKLNNQLYKQELASYKCVYFVAVEKTKKNFNNTVFIYTLDGQLLDQFRFKGQLKIAVKRKKFVLIRKRKNAFKIESLFFSTIGEHEIIRSVIETNDQKISKIVKLQKRKIKRFIRRQKRKGLDF